MKIDLPPNQKLVTATWKDQNVWYLTRPMRTGEVAEKFEFKEKSSWGAVQGSIIFQESISNQ